MISESARGTEKSVLIVDQSAENREVLSTALRRRGLRILEAAGPREGVQLAQKFHPEVIVLDVETGVEQSIHDQYDTETREQNSSMVILGRYPTTSESSTRHEVVQKPYHYGPLIRTIEKLAAQ